MTPEQEFELEWALTHGLPVAEETLSSARKAKRAAFDARPKVESGQLQRAGSGAAPQRGNFGYLPQVDDALRAARSGVSDLLISGFHAGKGLLAPGGLSKEDQAIQRELKAEAKADPHPLMRFAGNLAPQVAGVLATGAPQAITRAVAALPAAGKALALPAVGGATAGLQSVLTDPPEGDTLPEQQASRLQQAISAAKVGAVLPLAGRAVGKVLGGPVRPTREARQLMEQGIVPSVTEGTRPGTFAHFAASLAGKPATAGERGRRELEDALVARMSGGEVRPRRTLEETSAALRRHFDRRFDELLNQQRYALRPEDYTQASELARREVLQEVTGGNANTNQRVQGLLEEAMGPLPVSTHVLDNAQWQRMVDALNVEIKGANDPRIQAGLRAARNHLVGARDRQLDIYAQPYLERVKADYYDFKRFEAVARKSPGARGVSRKQIYDEYARSRATQPVGNRTWDELIQPSKVLMDFTEGLGQSSAEAATLRKTFAIPAALGVGGAAAATGAGGGGLTALAGAAYGGSFLSGLRPVARGLMGDLPGQRALGDAIKRGAVPSALTTPLFNQED